MLSLEFENGELLVFCKTKGPKEATGHCLLVTGQWTYQWAASGAEGTGVCHVSPGKLWGPIVGARERGCVCSDPPHPLPLPNVSSSQWAGLGSRSTHCRGCWLGRSGHWRVRQTEFFSASCRLASACGLLPGQPFRVAPDRIGNELG